MHSTSLDFDRIVDGLVERVADRVVERLAQQKQQSERADGLLDEPSMAEHLGVSPQSLERMRKAGTVPCIRVGRRVLYQPAAVLDALSTNEKGGAA
jgi:2,4-dienoyl-CoA reductase-like NADH-dependent reductase (Old Yellow Enzyme family)